MMRLSFKAGIPALAAFALMALYALTIPGNHTETEDSFDYAHKVRSASTAELIFPHHLGYLPAARALYATGIFSDPFTMLLGVNVLLGAGGILLVFYVASRRLALSTRAAVFSALFLAFSYGYWRYAVAAEIYVVALCMQALLCFAAFSPKRSALHALGCAVLASLAIVVHGPLSAPLAVVAVPLWFALAGRLRTLVIYGAAATILLGAAYYVGWQVHTGGESGVAQFAAFVKGPVDGGRALSPATLLKAVIGLGAVVISTNPVFALAPLVTRVQALMPYRNLTEELFMAQNVNPALAAGALAIALAAGGVAIAVLLQLRFSKEARQRLLGDRKFVAILAWLLAYAVLVMVVQPDSAELWICFLFPLSLVAGAVLDCCYRRESFKAPLLFCGLLFAYNFCGITMVRSPASDFNAHKAAWVLDNARAGDRIFTRDADVFTRYVRYHAAPGTTVVNCWRSGAQETETLLMQESGGAPRTYVFDDVFNPPAYLAADQPEMVPELAALRMALGERLQPTEVPHVLLLQARPGEHSLNAP